MSDIVTAEWILDHLPPAHGSKSAMADAIQMDRDKLAKVLKGKRRLTLEEAARIKDYLQSLEVTAIPFAEPRATVLGGFSEDDVQPVTQTNKGRAGTMQAICRILAPQAKHLSMTIASRDLSGFAILRGDCLVLDLNATPNQGDLVIAQVYDTNHGTALSLVRQYLPPYYVTRDAAADHGMLPETDPHLRVAAVVMGMFRAPQLAV